MASRTMYQGDTNPAANFSVSDETGILNLSTAASIEIKFIGSNFQFSGPGTAVQPPTVIEGVSYNLSYSFAANDTSEVDTYAIFVVVTWTTSPPSQIETFPTSDTLTVKPFPVPA